MKVVRMVRRIDMLQKAYIRARRYSDRHPDTDIDFKILDKLTTVRCDLSFWYSGPGRIYAARRKQVRLARRLLKIEE